MAYKIRSKHYAKIYVLNLALERKKNLHLPELYFACLSPEDTTVNSVVSFSVSGEEEFSNTFISIQGKLKANFSLLSLSFAL